MLDICLVVVGIGLIVLSYVFSERMDAKKDTKPQEAAKLDIWTEKDEKKIRERIEAIVSETMEDAMVKTDDQLSQVSNEKIMAVSEFSDQILEKIKQNHTEVVFLYDMLNDKDEKLRELLRELNSTKSKTEAIINAAKEAQAEKKESVKPKTVAETNTVKRVKTENKPKTAMDLLEQSQKTKKVDSVKKTKSSENMGTLNEKPEVLVTVDNQNTEILKLYKQGNSVMEIAKILGMGQGEVKLVIDLFQGTRG